jgi:hypothetical protein
MRVIQFIDESDERAVARTDREPAVLLDGVNTVQQLARQALDQRRALTALIEARETDEIVDLDRLLQEMRVLPPLDHSDPARFWVTGTGLTHLGSAEARDQLHHQQQTNPEAVTDSMKIFQRGVEGGKPDPGKIGAQPEWFYKGDGRIVVRPEQPLVMPRFALDGGDEVEVCGLYLNDGHGQPHRVGYALGNEYGDHVMEKQNYLDLAQSKLRQCAFGPELLIDTLPEAITGETRIIRDKAVLWSKTFNTGEANMCHSLANLEHHHFKHALFRQPGEMHCHFFGTGAASFGDGVRPQGGDRFEMHCSTFGHPLRNPIEHDNQPETPIGIEAL